MSDSFVRLAQPQHIARVCSKFQKTNNHRKASSDIIDLSYFNRDQIEIAKIIKSIRSVEKNPFEKCLLFGLVSSQLTKSNSLIFSAALRLKN